MVKDMKTYRFITTISKNGIIKAPLLERLYGKEVEVTVIPKMRKKKKAISASEFVNKWAGIINNKIHNEEARYLYLIEKYK